MIHSEAASHLPVGVPLVAVIDHEPDAPVNREDAAPVVEADDGINRRAIEQMTAKRRTSAVGDGPGRQDEADAASAARELQRPLDEELIAIHVSAYRRDRCRIRGQMPSGTSPRPGVTRASSRRRCRRAPCPTAGCPRLRRNPDWRAAHPSWSLKTSGNASGQCRKRCCVAIPFAVSRNPFATRDGNAAFRSRRTSIRSPNVPRSGGRPWGQNQPAAPEIEHPSVTPKRPIGGMQRSQRPLFRADDGGRFISLAGKLRARLHRMAKNGREVGGLEEPGIPLPPGAAVPSAGLAPEVAQAMRQRGCCLRPAGDPGT